ncbi:unnamed protein product [Clavelina lepadiformis]
MDALIEISNRKRIYLTRTLPCYWQVFQMKVFKLYVLLLLYVCIGLSQTQFVYNANEESGKDDYLGNIAQDMELMPVGVGKPPRQYTILNGAEFVRVDKNTGKLFTAVRLDREKLCPDNPETCKKDIEVAVLPSEYFQLIKIQLVVFDLNDNTPAFPSSQISKDISESAISGSVIRLDSAVDPDLGNNSINRYEISSSPPSVKDKNGVSVPYFKLDVPSKIDGTKFPQLILSKKLNREHIASYDLLLYAIDGADPPLTGTTTVHIKVTDSNDHQPTFPKRSYVISVPEDVNNEYEIIKLKAAHLDSGENARIVYIFPSEVSEQDRAIFALNSETGSLTVTGIGMDYENRTIHHLTIEAKDSGPNPAATYVTVTVQVEDVNDEKPRIDVNVLDQEESPVSGEGTESDPVLIRENTAVGTFVAFVTVTDRDTGKNGNVSCRLLEPTSFEMQRIDQNDNRYLLKTNSELDRETQRIHTVEIQAWDFGAPSLSNNKRIVVELVDENDNSPKFGQANYVLGVSENALSGDVIATLTAEDLDAGANAEITYSARPMERGVKVPFEIEPETGQVIFKSGATPLDAENKTEPFELTITATDQGVPPRNTSATLSISVADENDNPPRFRQKNYIFRIEENAEVGKYVGRVVADDADVEKTTNARVTYSFADGSKDSPFTIQPELGEIHFNGRPEDLDRESRHSQPYVLKAEATDHGNSPLTGICHVEIFLIDVNDNAPFIKFPNVTKDLSVVYIRKERVRPSDPNRALLRDENPAERDTESADTDKVAEVKPENPLKDFILIDEKGSGNARQVQISENIVITKIEAADPDEGESGRVRFAMSKGNDYEYFGVDMVTGNVTLEVTSEEQLRKMKPGCHVIEVKVSDLGKPTQATLTWVGIYVTDEDPVKFNKTKALRGCRNNSYFPDIYKHKGTALSTAGLDPVILNVIIGASALVVVIIIIVLILMLRRKSRRCQDKKSRTYNVPSTAVMHTDTSYTHDSPTVKRGQKGSPSMHHRVQIRTVDNRSFFHSEWNAQMGQLRVFVVHLLLNVSRFDLFDFYSTMVRKPSASSTSSPPPPSYSSFSDDSRFVPSRRISSGTDSDFTDQSTSSISKYEARAAICRHASTKRKYSTKAAEKMCIKHIETYTIWHDCLETVKEHRFKTTKQKPYKGNLSAGSRPSTGKIPNIWEMKVPYYNGQETKYYVIPHTSHIEKCSGCSGKGEEICYNCSGAGSKMCWYCHDNGMTDVTGHRYETNHYTNGQELVRHVTQETCHHCGGCGYSTCHTCGGRRANECRLCDGNGKMEKYSQLEVSR